MEKILTTTNYNIFPILLGEELSIGLEGMKQFKINKMINNIIQDQIVVIGKVITN
jgi:hypothetical protein